MRILILCTGNSCRSQIAAAWLRHFDSTLEVVSAGTQPADKISELAIKVMAEEKIDISNEKPKHVNQFIGQEWDYVITVCGDANENCPIFTGEVKHRFHFGFNDPTRVNGSESFLMSIFRKTSKEIKNTMAEFYLTEIQKLEIPKCSCKGGC
ncbi:MAG: arsenate reductase ArsC [Bacteroidia bacterium]|nr:arsenate reductase ArsC [Bacteroidia bacterium]